MNTDSPYTQAAMQQRKALRRANFVRTGNAGLLRQLAGLTARTGRKRAAQVLRNPVGTQTSLQVGALLGAVRYIGPSQVAKLCKQAKINERKPLGSNREPAHGELTQRQREALALIIWDDWRADRRERER